MYSEEIKEQARALWNEGKNKSDISNTLKVSRGAVNEWVRVWEGKEPRYAKRGSQPKTPAPPRDRTYQSSPEIIAAKAEVERLWSEDNLKELAATSTSRSDMLRKMGKNTTGENHKKLTSKLTNYGIPFPNQPKEYIRGVVRTDEESFVDDSPLSTTQIRRRLVKLRPHKCEGCQKATWQGKDIPLEVHHVNGNNNDHRLSNLQLLCVNCHSQTETFAGRANQQPHPTCLYCDKSVSARGKLCALCGARKREGHDMAQAYTSKTDLWEPTYSTDNPYWTEEQLRAAVAQSKSRTATLRAMGFNMAGAYNKWLSYDLRRYDIPTEHWTGQGWNTDGQHIKQIVSFDADAILVKDAPRTLNARRRRWLWEEGYLVYQCSACGLDPEWNGEPLQLQLEHINGDSRDHRIENLTTLCPNCHAQTDTYRGKNRKDKKPVIDKANQPPKEQKPRGRKRISKVSVDCLTCHQPFVPKKSYIQYCSVACSAVSQRRAERPSAEVLAKEIWEMPTAQLAEQYGVSDNAIGKWCKKYGIEKPPRGYWQKKNADPKD